MTRHNKNGFTYAALAICVLGLAYVSANSYALNLGALHHDIFCPDH